MVYTIYIVSLVINILYYKLAPKKENTSHVFINLMGNL